jgi:hypothetical protein
MPSSDTWPFWEGCAVEVIGTLGVSAGARGLVGGVAPFIIPGTSWRAEAVAQIYNLPYRGIAFGSAPPMAMRCEPAKVGGLQIRGTADCKSALRWPLQEAAPAGEHFSSLPSSALYRAMDIMSNRMF